MSLFHCISLAILVLILVGVAVHRRPRLHVALMATSCLLDFALVIWIEVAREAVEKAVGAGGHALPGGMLLFHILISVGVTVLWIVMAVLGVRVLRGRRDLLVWHRRMGMTFLVLRVANFVTSLLL